MNAGTLQAGGNIASDSGSICLCPHLCELAQLAKVQPELDFLCLAPSVLFFPRDFILVTQGKDNEGVNTTLATLPVPPGPQATLLHFLVLLSQVETGRAVFLSLPHPEEESDVSEGLQW